MLFLILFVTGIIPSDIIDRAGLTSASSWSLPMLLFAMGSMINLRQFIDEWRTVVTCWLARHHRGHYLRLADHPDYRQGHGPRLHPRH